MAPLLQFTSVTKRYGKIQALDAVHLSVESGSILALLGPNGAGKSTLFGCLLGLVCPTNGEILLRGKRLTNQDRRRFGYVAERVALYPQRNVWENGMFFARLRGNAEADLEHQLRRVGLHDKRDRLVRQLSKGMLQRLGLAIALCGGPEVLILDEPFNGLDPALLEELQQILREEQARGATLLIATHTISAVEALASQVAILLRGKLALHSTIPGKAGTEQTRETLEALYHRIAREQRELRHESIAA